jgi:uroporphyrinogen-III decarboxylase
MVLTGADALELDYKTDIISIVNALQHKTCLSGTVDPSGVLALGTREAIVAETNAILQAFGDANNLIACSGCALPPNTLPENMEAFVRTVRQQHR